MPGPQNSAYQDDDAGLAELWKFVWSARRLILAITVLCTAVALYIALVATVIYRAEIVIAPVRNGGVNAGGSLGNQLGGLAGIASLAGVNLDAGSAGDREAKAILQSRSLIEAFIQRGNLLGELLRDQKKSTLWLGVKEFKENVLTIRDDKRGGVTTIDIDWKDASVAAQWANGFVALANERIRARAIDEATRDIAFLTKQISQTNQVEVQRALYNLVENETKTLMLANARVEYAFTVIDPAVPPEKKFGPHRSFIVLGGFLAGLTIGFLAAYVRSAVAKLKKSKSA
ncbi:MAG: Wzz/FepE/Etk N-terminal domain-containing protein [Steroidobacteraceae bacterium]